MTEAPLDEVSQVADEVFRLRQAGDGQDEAELVRAALRNVVQDKARCQVLEHLMLAYGQLTTLLDDPAVEEVQVNGDGATFVVRGGKHMRQDAVLPGWERWWIVRAQLARAGVHPLSSNNPRLSVTLQDGARMTATHPVLLAGADGPSFSFRRRRDDRWTLAGLRREEMFDDRIQRLLEESVTKRQRVIFAGAPGSGKTTLMAACLALIHRDERLVSIQDTPELSLPEGHHHVALRTREVGPDGRGEVDITELVKQAKRLTPDFLVVGEVRDGAAADLITALSLGRSGGGGTLHAGSSELTFSELSRMARQGGARDGSVDEELRRAIDLIVVLHRDPEHGVRRVIEVAEVDDERGVRVILRWTGGRYRLESSYFRGRTR